MTGEETAPRPPTSLDIESIEGWQLREWFGAGLMKKIFNLGGNNFHVKQGKTKDGTPHSLQLKNTTEIAAVRFYSRTDGSFIVKKRLRGKK